MDLAAITSGISAGLAAAGIPKFDLIGFDACLMATVEVASSLRPYASYLLASEENEPGHGQLFGSLPELGATATALETAAAVIYQVRGGSYTRATGLSIYFPTSGAYCRASTYDAIPGMTGWRAFLSAYYGTGSSTNAPAFSGGYYDATATDLTLYGALQAGALASASTALFVYGVPGGSGDAWVYGDSPVSATNLGAVDHLTGSWDYGFLRLSQAAHAEFGYLSLSVSGTEGFASVPLAYYASASASAQPAFRLITLDLAAGAITSDVYYLINGSGAVGQL